jgi:hypothetical protein
MAAAKMIKKIVSGKIQARGLAIIRIRTDANWRARYIHALAATKAKPMTAIR